MKKKYGSFLFFSVVSNSGQVYLQATLTGYQTLCQYRHHLQGDFSQGISLESFLNVKMLQHSCQPWELQMQPRDGTSTDFL